MTAGPDAPDPLLTAAREVLRRSREDVRAAIEDLPLDALNWRPARDTNSIAALATHSLDSTRAWLCIAVDEPRPDRDRDSEFEFAAHDATELLTYVDEAVRASLALVDKSRTVDWSAIRIVPPPAGDPADQPYRIFAVWALLHALEHLREHVGQMMLTRQLWEQRDSPAAA